MKIKYKTMDETVKQMNKVIHLQTVKKVEALTKELKSGTKKLEDLTEVAYKAVRRADFFQQERSDIRKQLEIIKKDAGLLEKDTKDAITDATNKSQVAKGHESTSEGLEKRLIEATQALKAAAKNLGVPEPPVVKSVGGAISSSQGARIATEDLNDYA